jgi:hypothetical protein
VLPWRAPAAVASGAAGAGGHPLQGQGPQPPEYYGLSSGHIGRPGGDLAVGYVLAGAGRAIRRRAASQGGRRRRGCRGGEQIFGYIQGFIHESRYVIRKYLCILSAGTYKNVIAYSYQ